MAQVQIIQPYQPQSEELEKVAAYCRVSTDSKDQLNSYRTPTALRSGTTQTTSPSIPAGSWRTSTPMRVSLARPWKSETSSNGCLRTAGPGRSSASW